MAFDYWNEINEAVTICDEHGIIIYMNQASVKQFKKDGGKKLLGTSLLECHNEHSQIIIKDMLKNPRHNTYFITSKGKKKIIHQTPMYQNSIFKGLIEISILINETPEFKRD